MQNPECGKLEVLLATYAAEQNALTKAERKALEEHLRHCYFCQEKLTEFRRLGNEFRKLHFRRSEQSRHAAGESSSTGKPDAVQGVPDAAPNDDLPLDDEPEIEVPQEVLERLHRNLGPKLVAMELERNTKLAQATRRRETRMLFLYWALRISAAAAAVIIVVGVSENRYFLSRWLSANCLKQSECLLPITASNESHSVALGEYSTANTEQAIAEIASTKPDTPQEALRSIEGMLGALERRQDATSEPWRQLQNACQELVSRWPESRESLRALEVASRAYGAQGDRNRANIAFRVYAKAKGEQTRREAAASGNNEAEVELLASEAERSILMREGKRLFREGLLLDALGYFDSIIERSDEGAIGSEAHFMVARYYQTIGETAQAAEIYSRLLESVDDPILLKQILEISSFLCFNNSQSTEATNMCRRRAISADSPSERAQWMLQEGLFHGIRNPRTIPSAVKCLRDVIALYPESHAAQQARTVLSYITTRHANDMTDDFLHGSPR